jgi:hypothetical protein
MGNYWEGWRSKLIGKEEDKECKEKVEAVY